MGWRNEAPEPAPVRVLVVLNGGLVKTVASDTPGVEVRVVDMDRGDEPREDTAWFLWHNRDVLRSGRRPWWAADANEAESIGGAAKQAYAIKRDGYPHDTSCTDSR